MRHHASSSISLGRWGGLKVRLHISFLLLAVCVLFLAWRESGVPGEVVWVTAGSLIILLATVLWHEWAHFLAAVRLGGSGDEVVIGPLGGLAPLRAPLELHGECLMHAAGPLANLVVCLVSGVALSVLAGPAVLGLLHPLAPSLLIDAVDGALVRGLKLTFWINWVLLLANLLPVFPFDAGRALRAALGGIWPDASPLRATFLVATLTKVTAVLLLVVAWFFRGSPSPSGPWVPLWFVLVLLAVFLYFSAKHEEERADESDFEDDLFGYDFSQGYTSLERSAPQAAEPVGPFARWLAQRRQTKLRRQQEIEVEEERRVDEILKRLHQHGMEKLSDEERSLLRRVSDRYRQRNRP